MAIFSLGSINIDHVYQLPHLPKPGETLAATGYSMGLGGKGANQSVAAARAGASCSHIGAIGPEGEWTAAELARHGIDTTHIARLQSPTGHAIIQLDPDAENAITIFAGTNREITGAHARQALSQAGQNDILLMQNETSAQIAAAEEAASRGMAILYTPAPFDMAAVTAMLPFATLLLMNEGEAAALGTLPQQTELIITKGAKGAEWHRPGHDPLFQPAFPVSAVDTTGAGDCFAGTIAAARASGLPPEQALRRAAAAAALQVTRPGASQAMPSRAEVDRFLNQ